MERFGEEHVITSQYTWVLDRLGRRLRRVPIGNDPGDPTVPVPWLPYTGLWRDDRTGARPRSIAPFAFRAPAP